MTLMADDKLHLWPTKIALYGTRKRAWHYNHKLYEDTRKIGPLLFHCRAYTETV